MAQRSLEQLSQELQAELEDILGSGNVYYNPPPSVHMNYDAIVFNRSSINNTFANNSVYRQSREYEITTITEDPDAEVIDRFSKLPRCVFVRSFISDNLYHNVFKLHR